MAELLGIARRDSKRAPMNELTSADINDVTGVANDSRGKPGKRQVTVLSADAWRTVCDQLGKEIPWTMRRSNLLVGGIELPQRIGDVIEIGDVRLQVTMEVNPCSRMDEQCDGLTAALKPDWRGGVACTVLHGGSVAIGDDVSIQLAD